MVEINLTTCSHNGDIINNDNIINEIISAKTNIDISTLGNC